MWRRFLVLFLQRRWEQWPDRCISIEKAIATQLSPSRWNMLVHQQLKLVWKSRRIPPEQQKKAKKEVELKEVTVANSVADHEYMMKVRQGEPATVTLTHDYRKKMEQVLWVILNSPQFLLFVP